jgi:hypothetical protein
MYQILTLAGSTADTGFNMRYMGPTLSFKHTQRTTGDSLWHSQVDLNMLTVVKDPVWSPNEPAEAIDSRAASSPRLPWALNDPSYSCHITSCAVARMSLLLLLLHQVMIHYLCKRKHALSEKAPGFSHYNRY